MNMINPRFSSVLVGAVLALPLWAQAAEPATQKNNMLVDAQGMALYTYDKDADGVSNCTGQCAQNWPPLMAEAGAEASGEWSLVTRDDGTQQWAYDGKPLYTFIKDKKAGEMTGDGKKGVWHVARP